MENATLPILATRPPTIPALAAADEPSPAPREWTPWRAPWLALDALFWTAVSLIYAVQSAVRGGPVALAAFPRMALTSFVSFVPCILLTPPIAEFALRFRFGEGRVRRAFLAHMAGLAAFVLVAGPMMAGLELLLPWHRARSDFGTAMRWGALYFIAPDTLIYVLIVAAVQAVAYRREARERLLGEAQLRAQLADARLHALSAQLQPHFLFNTLHAISALVREEPQRAEQLLARLSDLLRHALRSAESADTTLGEELSFLEKYVEIQETRFGSRLQVTFDVGPQLLDVRVPSLLLQPLVENAIRHGIARRSETGRVEISAHREGSRMTVTIRDNGAGLPTDRPLREGIGLRATRARLRHFYGDDFNFVLARRADGLTECALSLPLHPATREMVVPTGGPMEPRRG